MAHDHDTIDVLTLRRIAFLVMRVHDDEGPDGDNFLKIGKVIERMKRAIAAESWPDRRDVASLCVLVRRLPGRSGGSRVPSDLIRRNVVTELQELVGHLRHGSRRARRSSAMYA